MKGKVALLLLLAWALWLLAACEPAQMPLRQSSLETVIHHADAPLTPGVRRPPEADPEPSRPLQLPDHPPEGWPGDVYVLTRQEDLTAFPCSRCHGEPLGELTRQSTAQGRLQHWDITLNHAGESTMTCATCHNVGENAGENVDALRTLTGQQVDFDASYLVCAQCHATQFEDWLGGAHGKQVGAWAPPRVMQGCADCHNPHAPQWDSRWPALPPKIYTGGE